MTHDHLARLRSAAERDAADAVDPLGTYTSRACAQAGLNRLSGPAYHNALADHLRLNHGCEANDPWPTTAELEAAHEQAHAESFEAWREAVGIL